MCHESISPSALGRFVLGRERSPSQPERLQFTDGANCGRYKFVPSWLKTYFRSAGCTSAFAKLQRPRSARALKMAKKWLKSCYGHCCGGQT
jgi:hypothetical protein